MNEFQETFYNLVSKYLSTGMNIGQAQIAALNDIQIRVAQTGKTLCYTN